MPLVVEWIVIGFFSAVGWKGADLTFEKMGWETTSIAQDTASKTETNQPKVLQQPVTDSRLGP
jgi:hypothetical protein